MAVVIKDFKLPESCDDCQFNWADIHEDTSHCEIKKLDTTDLILCRHDECPLVENNGKSNYTNTDEAIMKKFVKSLSPEQYSRLKEIVDSYSDYSR